MNKNNINHNTNQPYISNKNMGKEWKKMFCFKVYDCVRNVKDAVCCCVSVFSFSSFATMFLTSLRYARNSAIIWQTNIRNEKETWIPRIAIPN